MNNTLVSSLLLCIALFPCAVRAESSTTAPSTQPSAQGLVLLKKNCFACHNPEKKKGHLVLSSRDLAMRGDDEGPVIIAGKASESRLISALAADADPHMPPKKQLEAQEISALRMWVDAGAPWDDSLLAAAAPTTRPVTLHELPSTYRPVLAMALSSDEKQLAVGRRDRVYLHDLTQPAQPITRTLEGPPDAVRALVWSADGKYLAAGGYRRAMVWSMQTEELPIELDGLEGRITSICFAPNGDLFVADGVAGGPGRFQLFRLPDPHPQTTKLAHTDSIFALQCSRDGKLLASAGADKIVKLWELPDLKEAGKFEGHTSHVLCLAFSPDGALLASGGADRDLKIWDLKARDQKITIGPHLARIDAIAWPTANTLIAAGDDGSMRLDNTSEKNPGRALPAADDTLYCITATSDGKTLFGGCHDGRVYMWSGGKLQGQIDEPQ